MAIKINGLEVVLDRLDKIKSQEQLASAINDATLLLERAARINAGKISDGELANSIGSNVDGMRGQVYSTVSYAPYVEYGTGLYATGEGGGRKEVPWVYVKGQESSGRAKTIHTKQSAIEAVEYLREKGLDAYMTYGQHPQPFMRPALDENRELITQVLGGALLSD